MPSLLYNKLVLFLLLSLAVHAAVLVIYIPPNQSYPVHTGSPLTLSLAQNAPKPATRPTPEDSHKPSHIPATQARTASKTPVTAKQVHVISQVTPSLRKVSSVVPTKPQAHTKEKTILNSSQTQALKSRPAPGENNRETQAQMQRLIQQKLRASLAFYHYYPRIAIRNQWQGKVNLGVRIEANGRLSNVHIVQSSGYSILDTAAMNSLHRVASLPEAERWLHGHHLDMVLPVLYRLVDG